MDKFMAQSNPKRHIVHMELGLDESGYASFHTTNTLHNSTLNTLSPFTVSPSSLLGKADEENIKNLPNIKINTNNSITPFTHKRNATEQQTPGELNYSYPPAGHLSNCTPPFGSHERVATKRHKHQQHKQHASPKKSKKNLFPITNTIGRAHYFNGVENLDIIGKLCMLPEVMEIILKKLSAHTLDVMTHVSQHWRQIVHNDKKAIERLHFYHMKKRLTKENMPHNASINKRHSSNSKNVPFQNSNSVLFSSHPTKTANQSDSVQLLMVGSRVKCPCCGRSSQVYSSEQHNNSPQLSQTLPPNLMRRERLTFQFNSLDASFSTTFSTPAVATRRSSTPEQQQQTFAECMSAKCGFKFCLNCSCAYHPGEKCPVEDFGTPSKMLFCNESTTPPKRIHKPESKLTRKKSLKRLCF